MTDLEKQPRRYAWIFVIVGVLLMCAGAVFAAREQTYILTFGDSRFCSPETFFCKPVIVSAPDRATAAKRAGIAIWTIQEYADAVKLCAQKEDWAMCQETFALDKAKRIPGPDGALPK